MPDQTPAPGSRRVVLTGAAGRIGRTVAEALSGRWDLRLTDRRPDEGVDGMEALDVSDLEACRAAFAGAGVRRLVVASSLHAVSALPQTVQRRPGDQPRPANLHGATKAWSEAVGAMTAATTGTSVAELEETRRAIGYAPVDDAWAEEA